MSDQEAVGRHSQPLRLVFTEPAEEELAEAYAWLAGLGVEVADRWLNGMIAALEYEAELLGSVPLRRRRAPDAPDGRELFLLLYRTRPDGGSPWHIVYEVRDDDGDGKDDTLRVVRVRHAARQTT